MAKKKKKKDKKGEERKKNNYERETSKSTWSRKISPKNCKPRDYKRQVTANSKHGQNTKMLCSSILHQSREEIQIGSDSEIGHMSEQSFKAQLPTQIEMAGMFAKLENSLKTGMSTLHRDLGQILT